MIAVRTDGYANGLRYVVAGVMVAAGVYFAIASWHWALLCDSAVMHYVVFLIHHGLQPYSQISDNNLPGAYLTESWAMRVFGAGDLAWRVFEFFLLAILTLSMASITRPYDWVAGLYAGGMFTLLHGSEGPWYSVERDEVMTVSLMVGYAVLFLAIRRRAPVLMAIMGFTVAMAASIKPTVAPLAMLLVLIAAFVLWRRNISCVPYVLWSIAGMAIATAVNLQFLIQHHALRDFVQTQTRLTEAYTALNHLPFPELMRDAIPINLFLFALPAAALAVANRQWNWERWTLFLGMLTGLASYVFQHKGFLHHRYMFLCFLLLLMGIEFCTALRRAGWQRWLGACALALTLIGVVPRYLIHIRQQIPGSEMTAALETDLRGTGATADLQKQVQCLDMVYGCLNSLYHLRLVGNTGFTGDLLLFSPTESKAVDFYRGVWMNDARTHPAKVIVMTNEYFQGQGSNSYQRINNWPEYAGYLAENYSLLVERSFPNERGVKMAARQAQLGGADGYRIYILH